MCNRESEFDSVELLNKLSELSGISDDISNVYNRANQFNTKLNNLHSDYTDNLSCLNSTLNNISTNYIMYKKLERKVDNLAKLNVLMDSYIQCIQLPEELVEAIENDAVDDSYLLKHTYFLAKLDLCNQIQHENYPSLVWARVKLKQLLELANKRIFHQFKKMMEDCFKSNDFLNLLENKPLYDHLFKYSSLSDGLRLEYVQVLKKIYNDSLDENLKQLELFSKRSRARLKSSWKLARYIDWIYILESREYLSNLNSQDSLESHIASLQDSDTPEGVFHRIITKITSYNEKEVLMASRLFEIDGNPELFQLDRDYPQIREIFSASLDKLVHRCRGYLDRSEDMIGHLLILRVLVDSISYFDSNGYVMYKEMISRVKLMFSAKVQNIISNVINEVLDYNRICVASPNEYLASLDSAKDLNIEFTVKFIKTCLILINSQEFEDVRRLFSDLLDAILNTLTSLSVLQMNKIKEEIFMINHLAIITHIMRTSGCITIYERLDLIYKESCHRHIRAQIRTMFSPIVKAGDCSIEKLASLSRDFIASYKNILANVDAACLRHFHFDDTHKIISQEAKRVVREIWSEFIDKLEVFRRENPSREADELCKTANGVFEN